jgi:hypothetical protein
MMDKKTIKEFGAELSKAISPPFVTAYLEAHKQDIEAARQEGFRAGMMRAVDISDNTPTDGTPPSDDQRDAISAQIKKAIEEIR